MTSESKIKIYLEAFDKMTAPINKALTTAQSKLGAFAKGADKVAEKSFKVGKQFTASGIALAAPLVAVTKQAMNFEDAMADVAKVANLDRTKQEFKDMSAEVMKTSEYLGTSAEDVAKLYSSLKSGGTATSDLGRVSKIAGEASVAFDMSQEAAGEAFMTMKNSMGISVKETKDAFDATNAITNNFGGKASEILDFMSSGGASVARTLKATAPEMEAFGRSLTMSGVSASEAGTVMQSFRAHLYKNSEALGIFKKAGGGGKGMKAVFDAAAASGDPFKWFQNHKFGDYSSQMSLLSMNGEKLGEMLEFVGKKENYLNSANKEFASRTSTTSFQLKQAQVAFQNAAIKAGNALLPALTKVLKAITPLIEKFSKWVERNPQLVEKIGILAAKLAALSLAGGGVSFLVGGVTKVFGGAARGASGLARGIKFLTDRKNGLGYQLWVVKYRMHHFSEFMTGKAWPAAKKLGGYIGGPFSKSFNTAALSADGKAKPSLKSLGSFISGGFSKAIKIGTTVFKALGTAFSTNPIGLALKIIALLAAFALGYLIGKFGSVKAALNALGGYIKSAARIIFWPIFLVIDLVKGKFDMITNIIDNFKKAIKGVGKFFSMIFGGSKEAEEPVQKVAAVTQEVRDHLPSSPARKGALKTLDKVDLYGPIIKNMEGGKKVKQSLAIATKGIMAGLKGTAIGPLAIQTIGTGMIANFTINLNGSATDQDGKKLRKIIEQCITDMQKNKMRVGYALA